MRSTILLAAFALAASAPAFAQETRSVEVRYGDLNIASPAGKAVLQQRIGSAIDTVCGTVDGQPLPQRADVARCRTDAHKSAMRKFNVAMARAEGLIASR